MAEWERFELSPRLPTLTISQTVLFSLLSTTPYVLFRRICDMEYIIRTPHACQGEKIAHFRTHMKI